MHIIIIKPSLQKIFATQAMKQRWFVWTKNRRQHYTNSRGRFFLQPVVNWLRENKVSDIQEIQTSFQEIQMF